MAIKIIYYHETIDSWGRSESSFKPHIIAEVLKDTENFTDDMTFEDDRKRRYSIDDLIGKEVQVGEEIFTVEDSSR